MKMEISEILAEVEKYATKHVTVTGGEPLAQSACQALMVKLLDKGYEVSLETSGALDISTVDPRVIKVMDLKTPSSGESSKNKYGNIPYLDEKDQVKFVIGTDEDYVWSKRIMTDYLLHERCEVLFSPVSGQQNPTELAEKILQDRLRVRFQIQLHKLLWHDARGR
jgi:7-carboxy-7-deazaguanine synthase